MLTGHPRSAFCSNRVLCLTRFQYPELSVASYNKNPAALNEPDGIVAVWNLHLLERPEFVFHSQVSQLLMYLTVMLTNDSRMSCRLRFHRFIQTLCSAARTRGKYYCGTRDQSICRYSRRHYLRPGIRILCTRCKWLVHRMHTILSRAAQMGLSVRGLSTCLRSLR